MILEPTYARAEIPTGTNALLAKKLIESIAKKFEEADKAYLYKKDPNAAQIAGFEEGEDLLFSIRLKNNIVLDTTVLARIHNGELLISLRELILALEFPIEFNAQTGKANGWYIREDKKFSLDIPARRASSDTGQYTLPQNILVEDNDIFLSTDELGKWFGISLKPRISSLDIALESSTPLPVEERLARRGLNPNRLDIGPPVQPALVDENASKDYPLVDVSTQMSYTKPGDQLVTRREGFEGSAFIRTSGDIAGGTLTTQSSLNHEDRLTNVRATYIQQSLEPELLGPLEARRYELGDVNMPVIPLRTRTQAGLGARITNAHPLRNTLRPSTEIRGTTFPGWDVELYRNEQLVSIQTVSDDGVYLFEDVDLFSNENNFRVILYGPQGEIREEEIAIPVDNKRLSTDGSAYDIAVLAQDTQTYQIDKYKDKDNEDRGAAALTAVYELPVGKSSAISTGFETSQEEGNQHFVGHAGLSTSVAGTLLNLDTAVDQDGELAAQLVARRDLGAHKIRNETKIATDKFGLVSNSVTRNDVFSNRLNLNGPLGFDWGMRPRYGLGMAHAVEADGDLRQNYNTTLSANVFRRLNLNQQFEFATTTGEREDDLNSVTTLTGSLGKNRLRMISNYKIKPDSGLQNVTLDYRRPLTEDLDFNLNVLHEPNPKLTEGTLQLDWQAGFANISPSVSYDTNKELVAMLNTRFGIARDPLSKDIRSFDTNITSSGGVSAFVFLDKNGDNIFNGDDEPIEGAILEAPQNGGRSTTDEKGYAFFTRLVSMKPTDIFVQQDSLPDPFWVSTYQGFSIIPREGHITAIEFPVHMGGEIDGGVYLVNSAGENVSMRGISLSLYDLSGRKVKSTFSESDGFYLLDKVPPGRYYLVVDNKSFDGNYARPKPQPILIKTNGSTIYGNNVYLRDSGPDVAVNFYANAEDLKIDPSTLHGRSLFLNLGSYKSQLTLGLAWFKIRSIFKRELKDMELLEMPSESLPDQKSNNYVLRVLALSDDMSDAYNKCKVLQANGQTCSVEVIPEQRPERLAVK